MMRLSILLLVYSALTAQGSLDPKTIPWNEVQSEVRWLNFYQDKQLLTLAVDQFPALKNVKPAGHYSFTPFPYGSFQCDLLLGHEQKRVSRFGLKIENGNKYTLITLGKTGREPKTIIFQDAFRPLQKNSSRIRILNAIADSTIQLPSSGDELMSIPFGEHRDITFKNPHLQNWLILCHVDGTNLQTPRISYLQEGHSLFIEDAGD
jgi:hypothetical protein